MLLYIFSSIQNSFTYVYYFSSTSSSISRSTRQISTIEICFTLDFFHTLKYIIHILVFTYLDVYKIKMDRENLYIIYRE
jgi:hypothetical protein